MIIKKVEGKFIQNIYEGKECLSCGSVYIIYHQVGGEVIAQNIKFRELRQCDCGAVLKNIHNKWETYSSGYTLVKCKCGRNIKCHHNMFTNTCECGRDYNNFGELLEKRSEWGWESDETVIDILTIDILTSPQY